MHSFFLFCICVVMLFLPTNGIAAGADRPKLVVGGDHDNPPYEYLENGTPTGFNIELIQAVAEILGYDVYIRLGPWNKVRSDLEQGKIDALAGMYYSEERRRAVNFSVAHTMVSPAIFVRQDSPIRSFEDIRGKEIIVQEGDVIHDFLKKEGLASRIITVTDPADELRLLAAGNYDGAFMPARLQGEYFIKKHKPSGLRIINTNLPPLQYCFAVTKENPELRHKLDEGLNILKETGRYREIYEKWFGVYEKKAGWEAIKYFVWALALVAALFAISIFWSQSLQRQVRVRTAELRRSKEALQKAHADLEKRVEERTARLKEANEHLQSSEAEKSLILNSTMDMIVYHYPDMKIRWVNQVAAEFAGKDPEELIGQNCWEVWHQRTEPCVGCPVILARDTGLPQKAEVCFPEGPVRYIRGYPIKNDKGELTGLAEFFLDITEQKKTEVALRESEEEHRAIVEAFDGQIYICSHDYRIEFMNKKMTERTGRNAVGEPCYTVLHERDSVCPWCVNERVQKGETVRWEVQSPKDNHWYYVVNTPIYHADGTISKQAMILDITERREMEEALRISEEKYRNLVNNVNMGVFQTTVIHPGRLLQANPIMSTLTGYTHEELMQLSIADVYQDPQVRKLLMEELRAKGFVKNREVVMLKKDGTPVWTSLSMTAQYDEHGVIQWINGVGEDITERKRAEELLARKTKELERSNKELEHFASIASHDLKAPLSTIGGFAQLLYERNKNKLDEKAQQTLTRIIKGTQAMDALISGLLAYARVTSDGQSFRPVHCNMVINAALTNHQADIEKHRATITCDDLPTVYGDETQFIQLFQNLIGNAIKYRDGQPPQIQVSAKRVDDPTLHSGPQIPTSEFKTHWLFSVKDKGIGIDPAHAERIFEIFKRVHHGEKYAGTGIGLAICKKIVERHGGTIWVESEPGKGSTFFFTIPDRSA